MGVEAIGAARNPKEADAYRSSGGPRKNIQRQSTNQKKLRLTKDSYLERAAYMETDEPPVASGRSEEA